MVSLSVVIIIFALIFGSLFLIYGMNKEGFKKSMRRVGAHRQHHRPQKGSHS